MNKTIYIQPGLKQHAFTEGFLSSSEWVCVASEHEANVIVRLDVHGDIQCILRKASSLQPRTYKAHTFMSARNNPYHLLVQTLFAYANYVVPNDMLDDQIPHSKLIYALWEKQHLCRESEFEIGKAFGIFAADAINEENYLETQDGFNAAASFFDEYPTVNNVRVVAQEGILYEETNVPYEEAQHITFRVRED